MLSAAESDGGAIQRPQSSSASRLTAGAFGFFIFIFTQCGERPERYGEPIQLWTIDTAHIEWETIFTATFVISYLLAGIPIWRKTAPELFKAIPRVAVTFRWDMYLLFFWLSIVPAVVGPASRVLAILLEPLNILLNFALNSLHPHAGQIARRASIVLVMVWLSIFAILLFANLWRPEAEQCAWIFPKIITCVIDKLVGYIGLALLIAGTILQMWAVCLSL